MTIRTAGLWPRVVAFAIDYLGIAAYLVLLVGVALAAMRFAPGIVKRLFGNPVSGELTGFALMTLPVTLYFALSESSAGQATWGKRKRGLRVARTDGSGSAAVGRWPGQGLSSCRGSWRMAASGR